MGKKFVITESRLKEIIHESVKSVLNEEPLDTSGVNSRNMRTEMARINTDESNLFPYNSFEIQIWSNDHTPPHFHIIKDGWDVEFFIDSGELYKVKKMGKNQQIYNYIIKNVGIWLSAKCAILPMITNQQNATAIWKQLHG